MSKSVNIGVIGVGIIGEVLIKILLTHPHLKLVYVASDTYCGKRLASIIPGVNSELICQEIDLEKIASSCDIVFIAKPEEASFNYIPKLMEYNKKVIDLGPDFRLNNANIYKKWYKREHHSPNLLRKTIYGLPEINREKIKEAKLVANPGCYPVSLILGVAPVLEENLIHPNEIICNSYSGISGAGRTESDRNLFIDCNENMFPYEVTTHRHIPEMEQELIKISNNKDLKVYFIPHIAPLNRGILSTIYVKLKKKMDTKTIYSIYRKFYKNESFVNIIDNIPQVREVNYTNFCKIALRVVNHYLIIISVIDNLLKGGAGTAIQNLNIMLGIDEETGLKLKVI